MSDRGAKKTNCQDDGHTNSHEAVQDLSHCTRTLIIMVVGLEVVFYLSDINHSNQNPGYLNNSWSYQSVIDKKQTTKRRLRIVIINI